MSPNYVLLNTACRECKHSLRRINNWHLLELAKLCATCSGKKSIIGWAMTNQFHSWLNARNFRIQKNIFQFLFCLNVKQKTKKMSITYICFFLTNDNSHFINSSWIPIEHCQFVSQPHFFLANKQTWLFLYRACTTNTPPFSHSFALVLAHRTIIAAAGDNKHVNKHRITDHTTYPVTQLIRYEFRE